ncbi:MAG: M23 family metallopeptidase [bacterium]
MFPEPISIIISPHSSTKVYTLHLGKKALSFIFIISLTFILILSAYLGCHLYKFLRLEQLIGPAQCLISNLQKENKDLKLSLNKSIKSEKEAIDKMIYEREMFAEKLSNYEVKLKQLESFYNDLRIMAGFKLDEEDAKELSKVKFNDEGAMIEKDKEEGIGGAPEKGVDYLQVLLSNETTDSIYFKKTKEWEMKLMDNTKSAFDNMQLLKRLLEERASTVADTPTLIPVVGTITSSFGVGRGTGTHTGIDIGAPIGTKIRAPADGVVVFAGVSAYYGNLVILDHGNGFTTRFAHLSEIKVTFGDRLSEGDILGFVGQTGWATGPHLHYEVRYNGVALDPINYMKSSGSDKIKNEITNQVREKVNDKNIVNNSEEDLKKETSIKEETK